jgi:hypothetical protein
MFLVKLHDDAIVLARVMAPHKGTSWVFTQIEYPQRLPKSLPEFLPLDGHFLIVQNPRLVFLHRSHKLLFQSWVSGQQFAEHLNWDGKLLVGVLRLKLCHHVESIVGGAEHRAERRVDHVTNVLGSAFEIHERSKLKRIIKIKRLSKSHLQRLAE